MINQALFSSQDKSEKVKCRLVQFLFGTCRTEIFKMVVMEATILEVMSHDRYLNL